MEEPGITMATRFSPVFSLESSRLETPEQMLWHALDEVQRCLVTLSEPLARAGIDRCANVLRSVRRNTGVDRWKRLVLDVVRRHPGFDLFQQDPFTRRCFQKPRGYAGDPGMLDFAFDHPASLPERYAASEMGQFIAGFSTRGSAARAVDERRSVLARSIDDLSRRESSAKVLAIACGYLREAESSRAFQHHQLGRMVAIDHDPHSAQSIRTVHPSSPALDVRVGGPRDLLSRSFRKELGSDFDLVYTAGLFDYLSDRFARRLLAAMFALLKPGGSVLIANFVPELADSGYMEACMDWWLVYRTPAQMFDLLGEVNSHAIAGARTFLNQEENLVFLEVTRK